MKRELANFFFLKWQVDIGFISSRRTHPVMAAFELKENSCLFCYEGKKTTTDLHVCCLTTIHAVLFISSKLISLVNAFIQDNSFPTASIKLPTCLFFWQHIVPSLISLDAATTSQNVLGGRFNSVLLCIPGRVLHIWNPLLFIVELTVVTVIVGGISVYSCKWQSHILARHNVRNSHRSSWSTWIFAHQQVKLLQFPFSLVSYETYELF